MNSESFLSNDELEEAAFYLLTCSSIERYLRMAKQVAGQSKLSDRIRINPELIVSVIDRARETFKSILSTDRRDIPEFELAVLLCILTHVSAGEVDNLLLALSLADAPNIAWIRGLARKLRLERASNTDFTLQFTRNIMDIVIHNMPAPIDTPHFEFKQRIIFPKRVVPQRDDRFEPST